MNYHAIKLSIRSIFVAMKSYSLYELQCGLKNELTLVFLGKQEDGRVDVGCWRDHELKG